MKRLGRYAWQACPCPAFPRLRLSRGEPFRLTCSLARFLRWPVCNDAELIAKSPSKRSKSLESWLDVSGAFDWAGRASSHRRARTFAPSRWSWSRNLQYTCFRSIGVLLFGVNAGIIKESADDACLVPVKKPTSESPMLTKGITSYYIPQHSGLGLSTSNSRTAEQACDMLKFPKIGDPNIVP